MRTRSASVVLSSVILGCMGVTAQGQTVDAPSTQDKSAGLFSGGSLNPGVVPQPGLDSPGVVTGVTLGELYTDNLRLAADGQPKQSSWITEVQPFVKAAYSAPRFSGVFDYRLTGYLYSGQTSSNQVAQNLSARGTLTVLPQHLFLDGSALYGNTTINNQLPSGAGTFFLDNNRTNVGVGTLSPYWLQDLGRVGTMSLRYTRGRVVYNDRGISDQTAGLLTGIPDVTSNILQFSEASPKDQTWGWNLGYVQQQLNPDFGPGVHFAVAKIGASLQVGTGTRLLVDGGKENRFLPDGTWQKLDAPFWDAGFEWSNARDSFKLLAGHQFFGHSYELDWTHQAALLTTNVTYMERPTTYNRELLGLNSGLGGLAPVEIHPELPSLNERRPYLMKRLSASADYQMPDSTLHVDVYNERRTYFAQDSNQERVAHAGVSWVFDVGARTSITPSFQWQRYQFLNSQINYVRYAQLAFVHQINLKNFGSLRVRHDTSNVTLGASGAHGYDVNVVFAEWTHLF